MTTLIWLSLKVFEVQPSSEELPSWTHPLAGLPHWDLFRPTDCRTNESLLTEIQKASSSDILFLDIQLQRDQWVIFCSMASSGQLFQRWQEGLHFEPIVQHLKNEKNFFILNLHASQKADAEDLLKLLEGFEKSSKVAVISPSRLPIETLRKERPQWFFGADRASWTKVRAFHALNLTGLVRMWADFYVFSEEDIKTIDVDSTLMDSLVKQNKVLIRESEENDSSPEEPYRGILPVVTSR